MTSIRVLNRGEILSSGDTGAKEISLDVLEHGIRAADPKKAIRKNVSISERELKLFNVRLNRNSFENILVVGAGKASCGMAEEVESILSEEIGGGVVVTKYGNKKKSLDKINILEAGHPIPDKNSERGGEKILHIVSEAGEKDLIINLVSGGGSALSCAPVKGISLKEMQKTTDLLVSSGATIDEINSVRKHISRIKGGKLAREIYPGRCISLIVSDVVGDDLEVIASGPTAPDSSTFADAAKVLKKYSLINGVPNTVLEHLLEHMGGKEKETLKGRDFAKMGVDNILISSNDRATEAAKERGEELGFNSLILSRMIEGESREVGIAMGGIVRDIVRTGTLISRPALIISGGETTVTLSNQRGEGGPNQEFALGAALKIAGLEGVAVAAVDTDGTDGPTDVAGGIVDETTLEKMEKIGLDIYKILSSHNSKQALERVNNIIVTGSTGTNVNDLRVAVVK